MTQNNAQPSNSEETSAKPDYSHLSPRVQVEILKTLYRIPPSQDLITGLHHRFKEARDSHGNACPDYSVAWQKVQECLATADPLLAFAAWYTTWLNGNLAFTQMFSVEETKLGMGVTLFACKPFRVQLFLFKPGAVIPDHSHPDVDSYEVYIAGDMELTKDGLPQTLRDFIHATEHGVCASNGGMIRIPPGSAHGGWIEKPVSYGQTLDKYYGLGPRAGGAFLSIQHWLDNWDDLSVAQNWSGADGSVHG